MEPSHPRPGTLSRRVPPELRKRAALSCDHCKHRRKKCTRSVSGQTCRLCSENGVACITTIPRKRHSTAPIEDLPPRYLVMEQILAKLFPDVAVDDINHLVQLAGCLDQNSVEFRSIGDNLSISVNAETILPFDLSHRLSSDGAMKTPTSPSSPYAAIPLVNHERILQNSSGTLCYFGASSSMAFVMQLRDDLVLKDGLGVDSLQPKQQRLRNDFAADSYCSTMETAPALSVSDVSQQVAGHAHHTPRKPDSPESSPPTPSHSRHPRFVDSLPPRHEVEELVELFFVHIHPNMALFHRPLFQSVLEDLCASEEDTEDVGWVVCCFMVLVLGCEHILSSSTDQTAARFEAISALQRRLVEMAMAKVPQLMLSATLQSVQSFALLSLYLNVTNQRNAAWILMGCGIRMAISLGMHREDRMLLRKPIQLAPTERELRKRVWWSMYIYEQYNSALFGRPSAIDEVENTSDLPSESILDQGYHQPPGLIKHDVCLARIIGKIRRSQANQGICSSPSSGQAVQSVHELLRELDAWYEELPLFLKFDESNQRNIYPSHFRPLVTLQLRYQHARLILARPFHLKTLERPPSSSAVRATMTNPDLVSEFSNICVSAAFDSWRLTRILWENRQFNGSLWLDGVFLYQCGMVLLLAYLSVKRGSKTYSRKDLETAIEGVFKILGDVPPSKPLSRLIQIADDFSRIVRSMDSPAPLSNNGLHQDRHSSSQPSHSQTIDATPQDQPAQVRQLEPSSAAIVRDPWIPQPVIDGLGSTPNAEYPWFDNSELIDSMFDCDFPQAFGFDSGDVYQIF